MTKKNHQEKWINKYIEEEVLGQIANNFVQTGIFDPFSAKMPDTSVKFRNMLEKVDDNQVIYRFFPYNRFVSLIDEKKIAFISPLKYDDDEKEAECFDEYKNYIYKQLIQMYDAGMLNFEQAGIHKTGDKYIDLMNVSARWQKIYEYCRRNVFVSCWTFNSPASIYMWDVYTKNAPDAVAIKTTVGSLKRSILNTGHGTHTLDRVKYIDWQNESVSFLGANSVGTLDSLVYSLMHKQKRFEQDNELRIIIDNLTCNTTPWVQRNVNTILGDKDFDYDQYFHEENYPTAFLKETVDLNVLINEICLSPYINDESLKKIQEKLLSAQLQDKVLCKYGESV